MKHFLLKSKDKFFLYRVIEYKENLWHQGKLGLQFLRFPYSEVDYIGNYKEKIPDNERDWELFVYRTVEVFQTEQDILDCFKYTRKEIVFVWE